MSTTVVTYPMVMALNEADRILGPDRKWEPLDGTQARFLKEFFDSCRKESIPEIQSIASWEAADIATFLARRGFSLHVDPFAPDHFGTASALDLLVEWIRPGSVTTIERGFLAKRSYPGVHITNGVMFLRARGRREPIASLATTSGTRVLMTVLERPKEGFDLVAMADDLTARGHVIDDYVGVKFPMVHLDHFADISWIQGMKTMAASGVPAWIAKALQQTRLRINERGARAESAVMFAAVGAPRFPPKSKPPLVIDRPFLIWFIRQGLARPLFVGHITEEDWRNPGDITKVSG